ncbi:MAG: peptidoglycan-binding protein LysM [Thermoanaerobaculia bacterium]
MGLFSFIKDAGAKLLGADEEEKAPAGQQAPEVDPAEVRRKIDQKRSLALIRTIHDLGLEVEDLQVSIHTDRAEVRGKVPDQATKEKVVLVVGNTRGIAQVQEDLEVDAAEQEATFYTVESGDTLWKISKEQYGEGGKYMLIFEANKPMLTDPDKIYPGQVLRIPPLPAA